MFRRTRAISGQTLLETIIAIGVILVGVLSTITLVISNVKASRQSIARVTASNLAREGIEVVRNLRDNNWLQGKTDDTTRTPGTADDYNDFGSAGGTDGNGIIEFQGDGTWVFNQAINPPLEGILTQMLRINAGDLVYRQGTYVQLQDRNNRVYTLIPFWRLITITSPATGRTLVTAEVLWKEQNRTHTITMQDELSNWY